MATLSDANVRALFDQKWDLQVLQARYGAAVIMPRIRNSSSLVEESGEVVNITIKPRVTGGTVGGDGTFTAEAVTLTNVQINVNIWRYVSHIITDKQSAQAIVTLQTELPKQFGEKLAELTDLDLADLFTALSGGNDSLTPGVGLGTPGTGVTFDENSALAAVKFLRRRNIPLEDLSWILPPEAYYDGWLTKERLTSAYATGESKSLITTGIGYGKGFKQMILGIPAYESTLLDGSSSTDDAGTFLNAPASPNLAGTTAGALIHKEALGCAMQINGKNETVRTTPNQQLATLVVANNLYGVRVIRPTHGVIIYVKNT